MTEVLNLSTGESRTYELPPEQAVVVAYEQSCGNWSKARVSTSGRTVSCGDWVALATKGEAMTEVLK